MRGSGIIIDEPDPYKKRKAVPKESQQMALSSRALHCTERHKKSRATFHAFSTIPTQKVHAMCRVEYSAM